MTGCVSGQVVRAGDGAAVPDAEVAAVGGPRRSGPVVTGPGGTFFLGRLPAGRWRVTATTPAGRTQTAGVYVFDDAVSELTIEVPEPRANRRPGPNRRRDRPMTGGVRGRVVDADDGRPVPEAAVSVVRGPGPAPDIAPLTDEDGRFALDGLPVGDWRLRAIGPAGEAGEATVLVAAGTDAQVVIAVSGEATPEGD